MDMQRIIINKNRGWRGLAEVQVRNSEDRNEMKMVFSFSEQVWNDMLKGYMVLQDSNNYYVLHFDNTESLPKGQRSVLLKEFTANILEVCTYNKISWIPDTLGKSDADYIYHFNKNRNNHTTSDWNCIGIRVTPMI